MNRNALIQKLKTLEGLTAEEKAELIKLVNTKKKYGLVWEEKTEAVEELLREQLPVLKEVMGKRIWGADLPPEPAPIIQKLFEHNACPPHKFSTSSAD